MRKLAFSKINVSEFRLVYVAIYASLIPTVNVYSYAKALMIKLKERLVLQEGYGILYQAKFSVIFENGIYGVSIKLAFLPQTDVSSIQKAIMFILGILSENVDMANEKSSSLDEELMNLKPAMALEMSCKKNVFFDLKKITYRLMKPPAINSVDILYTGNILGELEHFFANRHYVMDVKKIRKMKYLTKGSIYTTSINPCCMVMAFPIVNSNNYFEWKVVGALFSILIFEVVRTEKGMVYDLGCNLDLTNNVLCVQAGLGRKDSGALVEIIDNIRNKIIYENYAIEKLEGVKQIQILAFEELCNSPEELLDASFLLSYYGLNKLNLKDIEKVINKITWENVKRRIQELEFSFMICSD